MMSFAVGILAKPSPKLGPKGVNIDQPPHMSLKHPSSIQFHPVPVGSHGFPLGPCEQLPVQLPQYLGAAWGLSQLGGVP